MIFLDPLIVLPVVDHGPLPHEIGAMADTGQRQSFRCDIECQPELSVPDSYLYETGSAIPCCSTSGQA
eukprot:12215966-Karenia_brevis.AAC.1